MNASVPVPGQSAGDPFAGIAEDLELLDGLAPADQVPVFTRLHSTLTSALTTTAPAAGAPDQRPSGGR